MSTLTGCHTGREKTGAKPPRALLKAIGKDSRASLAGEEDIGFHCRSIVTQIVINGQSQAQMRANLWGKRKRELSLLKLVRHFQALAERWMQAIFQPEFILRRFLSRACATAERLAAKALRKRRTTAQILREHLPTQHEPITFAEAVNAWLNAYAPAGALDGTERRRQRPTDARNKPPMTVGRRKPIRIRTCF